MSKKNEPKNKKKSITKATSEERERIEELEKRVRSLQIENAFLKELRKLRNQEAQQLAKTIRPSKSRSRD